MARLADGATLGGGNPAAQPAQATFDRDPGATDFLDRSSAAQREGDVEHA